MPLYEFECEKCGRRFEAVTPADVKEGECSCGALAPRQVSAPGGYQINGSNPSSTRPKGAGSWFKKGK